MNSVREDKNVSLDFINQLKMWVFSEFISFDEIIHSLNKNNGPCENSIYFSTSNRCNSNIYGVLWVMGCSLLSPSDILAHLGSSEIPDPVICCQMWIHERHCSSGPSNTSLLAMERDCGAHWFFSIQIWTLPLSRNVFYFLIFSKLTASVSREHLFKGPIKVFQVWKS